MTKTTFGNLDTKSNYTENVSMYLVAFTATKRYYVYIKGACQEVNWCVLANAINHCVVFHHSCYSYVSIQHTQAHTNIILSVFSIFKISIRIFRWQVFRFHWKKEPIGKKTTTPPKVPKSCWVTSSPGSHLETAVDLGILAGKNPTMLRPLRLIPSGVQVGFHKNIFRVHGGGMEGTGLTTQVVGEASKNHQVSKFFMVKFW